jgi:hypothetical protein
MANYITRWNDNLEKQGKLSKRCKLFPLLISREIDKKGGLSIEKPPFQYFTPFPPSGLAFSIIIFQKSI